MNTVLFAALAAGAILAAGSSLAADRHDDHHPVAHHAVIRHHAHQVCTTHHRHRVCHMVR